MSLLKQFNLNNWKILQNLKRIIKIYLQAIYSPVVHWEISAGQGDLRQGDTFQVFWSSRVPHVTEVSGDLCVPHYPGLGAGRGTGEEKAKYLPPHFVFWRRHRWAPITSFHKYLRSTFREQNFLGADRANLPSHIESSWPLQGLPRQIKALMETQKHRNHYKARW